MTVPGLCLVCPEYSLLVGHACVMCPDNEFYHEKSDSCQNCRDNCLRCTDKYTCDRCSEGYMLNGNECELIVQEPREPSEERMQKVLM